MPHNSESRYALKRWEPENATFWQQTGQRIAQKNLWISVFALLLSFCVWQLFSAVAVNLNRVGYGFTTDQLFLLTALPALSGALLRVPYSFMVAMFGGRMWTVICTAFLILPCILLALAVHNVDTPFWVFASISLLCGFAGANFASSMGNISLFFPKDQQGMALGINGGLGNLGVSVMQFVSSFIIFVPAFALLGARGVPQLAGGTLWPANAALIWVVPLVIATLLAWFGMNDISSLTTSLKAQLLVIKRGHVWVLGLLYLATFGSFIGFCAGFAILTKSQFPSVAIVKYAFLGPLVGALARPLGGMISDKLGGIKVTSVNFILMAIFSWGALLTLPGELISGFWAFFAVFMGLFITAGLGSGSTFQMIAVIFRRLTIQRAKSMGASDEEAQREAVTDTSVALGFISAIGAFGGFFIPKAFGSSITITGSPVDAMKIFFAFYIVCFFITWLVYGKFSTKQ